MLVAAKAIDWDKKLWQALRCLDQMWYQGIWNHAVLFAHNEAGSHCLRKIILAWINNMEQFMEKKKDFFRFFEAYPSGQLHVQS